VPASSYSWTIAAVSARWQDAHFPVARTASGRACTTSTRGRRAWISRAATSRAVAMITAMKTERNEAMSILTTGGANVAAG